MPPGPTRVAVPTPLRRQLRAEQEKVERARAAFARHVAKAYADGYSVRAIAQAVERSVSNVHALIQEGRQEC